MKTITALPKINLSKFNNQFIYSFLFVLFFLNTPITYGQNPLVYFTFDNPIVISNPNTIVNPESSLPTGFMNSQQTNNAYDLEKLNPSQDPKTIPGQQGQV